MTPSQPPDARVALLQEWKTRAEIALFAHNLAANRCKRAHVLLGALSAVLSAVVGTTVFATLDGDGQYTATKIAVGAISLLAAVGSALVTFANFPAKMDDYQRAARRYAEIRREIEHLLANELQVGQGADMTDTIRAKLDEAAQSSPNPPQRVFDKVRRQRRGQYTYFERARAGIRGLPPEVQPVPREPIGATSN